MRDKISQQEVRSCLAGPVASVKVPFCRDGAIDYHGLRTWVEVAVGAGSKTVLLTYGDSLYSLLTDEEVTEVTKRIVEFTAGRAMVVAADRVWWTGKTVQFARYCREIGVDVLMVLPPDWANSGTVDTFVAHYAVVAKEIPVMVVTNLYGKRQTEGLQVMERVRDQVDGVVAVKDDVGGEFARKMCLLMHDKMAVFAGGQKQNHLDLLPYGCDGYLSTFISLEPSIAWTYWKAIAKQDLTAAVAVIQTLDLPYFNFIETLPGGFDAGQRGMMELMGICGRWRREPYCSLSDADMARLKAFWLSLGWAGAPKAV